MQSNQFNSKKQPKTKTDPWMIFVSTWCTDWQNKNPPDSATGNRLLLRWLKITLKISKLPESFLFLGIEQLLFHQVYSFYAQRIHFNEHILSIRSKISANREYKVVREKSTMSNIRSNLSLNSLGENWNTRIISSPNYNKNV